jgi:hypothetical protein
MAIVMPKLFGNAQQKVFQLKIRANVRIVLKELFLELTIAQSDEIIVNQNYFSNFFAPE